MVLDGASGMGKSTLLKLIYANYRASAGRITVRPSMRPGWTLTQAIPRAAGDNCAATAWGTSASSCA